MSRSIPATALFATALVLAAIAPAEAARGALARPGVIRPLTGPQQGEPVELALAFVRESAAGLGITARDLDNARLVDSYLTRHNGVTHVFLRQRLDGIEVFNGDISVHVAADGRILAVHSLFASELRASINTASPELDAAAAVTAAAGHLGLALRESLLVEEQALGPNRAVTFAPAGISRQPIPAHLEYYERAAGDVRLAWSVGIYEIDDENYWNMLIDAESGAALEQLNRVDRDSYRVYELPVASPNHVMPRPPADGRALVVDPADPTASPYGWHSTTTTPGEFQSTRGNNVDAYEDQDNSDAPTGDDARAVVGASLDFDFAIDLTRTPDNSVEAGITNLFYTSNMIHDIMHHYGFDEASGNFQVNNYGLGGDGGDDVQAEAQDGGGRNNANFFTPTDGERPRMQMYLWDPPNEEMLIVSSPDEVAGSYVAVPAAFGPAPPPPPGLSADLVMVDDGTARPEKACSPLVNGAAIAGNIAVAETGGGCNGGVKAVNAEAAGAIALIVLPHMSGVPFIPLPGTANPGIPTVMITFSDAESIRAQLPSPGVTGTLLDPPSVALDVDGDVDNELIIHEYGHGISNRLVGGRTNVDCLSGSEQAGEGWSDLLGLMLTAEVGDTGADRRGIVTYANGDPVTGKGLRDFPYSTDVTIFPLTYGQLDTLAIPHGTGSVWAAAGWEVFWAMTDRYGFDPDLVNGTAGNNNAIQLIIDGMKLGPCTPGFVDNRDAVLMADQVNNGGVNQCLLWEAFAKRGLGFSADQGDVDAVGDETEAFDLPPECDCPAPVEQGNILRAWRGATNVELEFVGATGSDWRIFRDDDKGSLRTTGLSPDVATTRFTDLEAAAPDAGPRYYYRVTEVDCGGNAGP